MRDVSGDQFRYGILPVSVDFVITHNGFGWRFRSVMASMDARLRASASPGRVTNASY